MRDSIARPVRSHRSTIPTFARSTTWARWNRNGKELFFVGPDSKLYAAETTGLGHADITPSPRALFEVCPGNTPTGEASQGRQFDVAPDGQKFLFSCGNDAVCSSSFPLCAYPSDLSDDHDGSNAGGQCLGGDQNPKSEVGDLYRRRQTCRRGGRRGKGFDPVPVATEVGRKRSNRGPENVHRTEAETAQAAAPWLRWAAARFRERAEHTSASFRKPAALEQRRS